MASAQERDSEEEEGEERSAHRDVDDRGGLAVGYCGTQQRQRGLTDLKGTHEVDFHDRPECVHRQVRRLSALSRPEHFVALCEYANVPMHTSTHSNADAYSVMRTKYKTYRSEKVARGTVYQKMQLTAPAT